MLLSTDLLTDAERCEALDATPWSDTAEYLAGHIRAALDNGSLDVMEVALGPGHARSALVALYEAADVLLQASMDLAESVARQRYFTRVVPLKPLGDPTPLEDHGRHRYPIRLARYAIEDAGVKLATAGDHLVNASLRFAWEANAASRAEVKACGFDPAAAATPWWASVEDLARGLRKLRDKPVQGPLSAFRLSAAFDRYYALPEVGECRAFRHGAIHGERRSYQEAKAFGRSTIWAGAGFTIRLPSDSAVDRTAPSLGDARATVCGAAQATLAYTQAVWEFACEWLRSMDVWITVGDGAVRVETRPMNPRWTQREKRDPGQWLPGSAAED